MRSDSRTPYRFRWCRWPPDGNSKHPALGTFATIVIFGKLFGPAAVTGLDVKDSDSTGLSIGWDENTEPDVDGYELRVGTNWLGALTIGWVPRGSCVWQPGAFVPDATQRSIHIKAKNTSGIDSLTSASVDHTVATSATNILTDNQGPAWAGTIVGMTDTGTDLVSNTGTTVYTYTTTRIDLGAAENAYPTVFAGITIEDRTSMTWGAAHFAWEGAGGRARTWGSDVLTDYPDSYRDAVTATWGNATFPWDSTLANGRTWSGLTDATFFPVTLKSKTGLTTGAHDAASYVTHRPFTTNYRYISFELAITVPDDEYLVTVTELESRHKASVGGTAALNRTALTRAWLGMSPYAGAWAEGTTETYDTSFVKTSCRRR